MMKQSGLGFVQVYTGLGKGKTTAALGLALRAVGNGLKVYIGQFMKGTEYGELKIQEYTNGSVEIEQYGTENLVHQITEEDEKLAQEGLNTCFEKIKSEKYDLVILDEINVAVYFKLIDVKNVLKLIDQKPKNVELVLTGRYAHEDIIEKADLVTEMMEIKHYFQNGVEARKGIER